MCGIVGIFDTRGGGTVDRALLERMNQSQFHRGPDEGGIHVEPGVGFGHRRLSIIDLSSGQQPLFNEDGSVVVVFNGEIYNYQELMAELIAAGHTFRTRSDTEVIVHAWEQWGDGCVARMRGMFAFAIWDRNRKPLFLARDRLGVKPLYYALLPDGHLIFSSELKALMTDARLTRQVDPHAVEDYFAYGYVPEPKPIYTSARKLPPAHNLTLRSGAVVAKMAEVSDGAINTCSISFGDPAFNEAKFAAMVAERYRTHHYVDQVEADDYDLIDTLAGVYDEPYADSSALPTYRVCQLARKHVTVVLSGDGGDENLAGYRRYRWHLYESHMRGLMPAGVRQPLFGLLGSLYPKADWAPKVLRAKTTFEALARDDVEGYFHGVSVMGDEMRRRLFSDGFRRSLQGYRAVEVMSGHAAKAPEHPLSRVQYLDMKTYLVGDILTKVDRASMAHALEVREPLLDHKLMEWWSGLSPDLKLNGREGKYIFKKALEPYLPHDVLYRPKMGFSVPLAAWFRGPLRQRVRDAVLGTTLAETGIFNTAFLREMVDHHQSGRRDYSAALWAVLMFEAYQRKSAGTA